jgi:hypothetical protein
MPAVRWLRLLLSLLVVALIHAVVALPPSAFAQSPPTRDRDQMVADARLARDKTRAEFQQKASATCGNRGRYEGDLLILQFDRRVEVLRDRIVVDEPPSSGEIIHHLLESCNDKLGLFVVQQLQLRQGAVAGIGIWVDMWAETILVHPTRWGTLRLRWFGTPIVSPDEKAIASCEFGAMADAHDGIHIAVRDEKWGWRKLWHHLPNDMLGCKFLRWEGPNRFRVLMHDQVLGGGNHWESIIEFTPTTLTRTDGPKTPDIPPNPRP